MFSIQPLEKNRGDGIRTRYSIVSQQPGLPDITLDTYDSKYSLWWEGAAIKSEVLPLIDRLFLHQNGVVDETVFLDPEDNIEVVYFSGKGREIIKIPYPVAESELQDPEITFLGLLTGEIYIWGDTNYESPPQERDNPGTGIISNLPVPKTATQLYLTTSKVSPTLESRPDYVRGYIPDLELARAELEAILQEFFYKTQLESPELLRMP